jgi:hypothetical protein
VPTVVPVASHCNADPGRGKDGWCLLRSAWPRAVLDEPAATGKPPCRGPLPRPDRRAGHEPDDQRRVPLPRGRHPGRLPGGDPAAPPGARGRHPEPRMGPPPPPIPRSSFDCDADSRDERSTTRTDHGTALTFSTEPGQGIFPAVGRLSQRDGRPRCLARGKGRLPGRAVWARSIKRFPFVHSLVVLRAVWRQVTGNVAPWGTERCACDDPRVRDLCPCREK